MLDVENALSARAIDLFADSCATLRPAKPAAVVNAPAAGKAAMPMNGECRSLGVDRLHPFRLNGRMVLHDFPERVRRRDARDNHAQHQLAPHGDFYRLAASAGQ